MKPINAFEHEEIAPLSEGQKTLLYRLHVSFGRKLFNFDWRTVRATSNVGVVQLGTRAIQVLPKMFRDGPDAEECQREATGNLLFLLSYTRKLQVTETEIATLVRQQAPLSEILYWIFARRLWDAVRREVLRGYVTIEDRLDVLKGRWLVAAQARRPDGWRRDRFDVAFDEFTEDNLPNRLLKATVHRLSQWAAWTDTRRHLAQLRAVFADVADVTPQPKDFAQAAQWMLRYRRRASEGHLYRPILEMAQMFWTGTGPQLSPGRSETFAFMFDMNQLFEEFIAEFIRRELREVWQSRRWSFHAQSATRALLCDEAARPRFWLKPDVRFETTDGTCSLIVDTKYKLLDPVDAKAGIVEADAYQIFAYKERHRCPRVVLLYPQTSERIARDFSADTDSPSWLEARTVDLRREFVKRSDRQLFAEELTGILCGREESQ